jgi:uncharacterized protein (DUF362 family)
MPHYIWENNMTACTRRHWIASAAATAASTLVRPFEAFAQAPAAPVAVARCDSYGSELVPALAKMFDQIGGLGRLVNGKTVTIKTNLTGGPSTRLGYVPAELAHWTHPAVVGAACYLMSRAGARRIRVVECAWCTAEPLEEFILQAGWDPNDMLGAAKNVELCNTNWLGKAKEYSRFMTPQGGHIFKGFLLNHAFEECDVFCSIAKLKEHATAGVTLSMKNCFGSAPTTVYGDNIPKDRPGEAPLSGRGPFHYGNRQPALPAWPENDPKSPRQDTWRVPRIVADIVAARPIHLAIIEGIASMTGGEGPWIRGVKPVWPRVMIVGTNPVCTDAAGMAVMGFDPLADRGTAPFEKCDSTLRLAEELGVGTRDLKRIEVLGTPIQDATFNFRKA